MPSKLTVFLLLVAAGLAFAASSPRRSLQLVKAPETAMREVRRLRSRMDWKTTLEMAEKGDTDAMFAIGMEMTRRHGKEVTGIAYNPGEARVWLQKAAENGRFPARLALWKVSEGSSAELLSLLPPVPDDDVAEALRQAEVQAVRPALRDCHLGLHEYALTLMKRSVDRQMAEHPASATTIMDRWTYTEAMLRTQFDETCAEGEN